MPKKGKGSRKRSPSGRGKRKGSKGSRTRKMMTLDKVRTRRRGKRKKKVKRTIKRYKLPSEQEVIDAIQRAMARDRIVRSQTELKAMVIEELKAMDPGFTITGDRLRKVAMEKVGLTVEIQGREVEGHKAISKCPVCRSPLKATKNVTIYGGTVTLGFKCTKCPYWTGKKRRVPTRYTFYLRKK